MRTYLQVCLFVQILSSLVAKNQDQCPPSSCYLAAVYEHQQLGKQGETAAEEKKSNLDEYEKVARVAKVKGVKVLVFPEDGIFGDKWTRKEARNYLEEIPDEYTIPCGQQPRFPVESALSRLSCMAKNHSLYIAANMGDLQPCDGALDSSCPADGAHQFNTEVLFDSNGALVGKYHKYHLFGERMYDVPANQSFVAVDTPFGKMGLFICFDAIFQQPGRDLVEKFQVDTILYPTWWFDELPFLSAHQYQQAWAMKYNVNYLAANINKLNVGSVGSGIYSGKQGALIYSHDTKRSESKLLIAEVPMKNSGCKCDAIKTEMISIRNSTTLEYKPMGTIDINTFRYVRLVNISANLTVCQDGLCCHLNYSVDMKYQGLISQMILGAGNRTRGGRFEWSEEMCILVAYDETKKSYNYENPIEYTFVNLNGNFTTPYVFPSVVSKAMGLVSTEKWKFDQRNPWITEITANGSLTSITLYGRPFQRDPPYSRGSAYTTKSSFLMMMFYIIYIFAAY